MPRPDDVGVGVAIALVDENENQVLLMQRKGSHAAGTWALPGGWIDRPDKSLLNVVKREAMEEVGVTVLEAEQVGAITEDHPDMGFRTVTIYYLVTKWTGSVSIKEPEKCGELRWCPLHKDMPTPPFPGLDEGLTLVKGRLIQYQLSRKFNS